MIGIAYGIYMNHLIYRWKGGGYSCFRNEVFMMKAMKFLMLGSMMVSASAWAGPMICEGPGPMGDVRVTLDGQGDARVERSLDDGSWELIGEFSGVASVWDGHMTGLATAPGLSIKYENHFGCLRDVVVTTHVRKEPGYIATVIFPTCKGGQLPDDLCLGTK